MPLDVAKFMAGLGLKVYDVYGMTETCGAVTANGPGGFKLGTVGRANPGMEVKLGEDGEILVRGPVNTPGYHLQEEATCALIDADGGRAPATSARWTTMGSSRSSTARRS